jgi:similar to stage IV sporulation protein
VSGDASIRFLNLCKANRIEIYELHYHGENTFEGIVSVNDFFRLAKLRRKAGVHIRILRKYGFPFFLKKRKKYRAFLLGICGAVVLFSMLDSRIWKIEVSGNQKNSTTDILEYLKEEGIYPGSSRKSLDCSAIVADIRSAYSDIAWVSAKLEGTSLVLSVRESTGAEEEESSVQPCDLVSGLDGTIVKMVTRSGTPEKSVGDTCTAGERLVSGSLEIMNDDGEVVRTAYVHADADIYVSHSVSYYDTFPLAFEKNVESGPVRYAFGVRLGSWYLKSAYLPFSLKKQADEEAEQFTREMDLPVFFSFGGNFSMQLCSLVPVQTEKQIYSETEAKEEALLRLENYEKNLIESGITILENRVHIKIDASDCISSGELLILEKTGVEAEIEQD